MLDIFLAYLIALTLISGMVALAFRNQRQGWHRQRGVWKKTESTRAVAAFTARVDPPLQHLDDLLRLQQSLAHETEPIPQEELTPSR